MKPFLVGKQGESKRLVKVSLKLVREIVFPVVISISPNAKLYNVENLRFSRFMHGSIEFHELR